jgi:hypothetical protein
MNEYWIKKKNGCMENCVEVESGLELKRARLYEKLRFPQAK